MTVYENNLPLVSDKIRNFPGDVSSKNWPYLNTTFSVDHLFALDTATANNGCHKSSTYYVTTAPTTTSTQYAIYCKNDTMAAPGPYPQLWTRKPSSGTEIQLTAGDPTNVPTIGNSGCTYLPGGLLMQWGRATANGTAIGFPVSFSSAGAAADPYSVTITLRNSFTANRYVSAITDSTFTVASTGGAFSDSIFWIAIGPKT